LNFLINVLFFIPAFLSSEYFIAIEENKGQLLGEEAVFLNPPKGRFYADPFLFHLNGKEYLFFEDCNYKKGVISYVLLEEGKISTAPQVALETPWHLSFPFLFQEGEEIYMMPETYYTQEVVLYRAVRFPNLWQKEKVLIRGKKFSDPILFKYQGYYWLFTAIKQDLLQIYYAKDLDSPFVAHPINQKKVRGRNAGAIFYKEGKWIRPTMDCSIRYGRSMVLKEIICLTTKSFEEREVAYIEPNWAPSLIGTHTYNISNFHIVYDGERAIED
jgi:hypothetical protein